jgi:VanZ family protein
MRLTPHLLMRALRIAGVLGAFAAVVALAGPFRYKDLGLPFPDTVAHAMLFYGLTVAATTALPRARAADVSLAMLGLGALSEIAQSLVGREMSFHDLAGDAAGILIAYTPLAMNRLRELARTHPHMTFAELRRIDRRRGAPAATPDLVPDTTGQPLR